jgi:hypothetical protein
MDCLGLGLSAGHIHGLDQGGYMLRHIIIAQQLGQAGGGFNGRLGNLRQLFVRIPNEI